MTCIVGLVQDGKVYIGGDSAAVAGIDVRIRRDTKVFKVQKKFLIGYTSSFRMGQLLRFKLKVPSQLKNQSDYEYMCTTFIDQVRQTLKEGGYTEISSNEETIGTFLVGYKGKLYEIESDLQVGEYQDSFNSVGCGSKYALGALEILSTNCVEHSPEYVIHRTLETAVKFSGGVMPPFTLESL